MRCIQASCMQARTGLKCFNTAQCGSKLLKQVSNLNQMLTGSSHLLGAALGKGQENQWKACSSRALA